MKFHRGKGAGKGMGSCTFRYEHQGWELASKERWPCRHLPVKQRCSRTWLYIRFKSINNEELGERFEISWDKISDYLNCPIDGKEKKKKEKKREKDSNFQSENLS